MPLPDYYKLLDVSPTIPQSELKQAYYRQARKHHPDRNEGNAESEELFKQIAEAYRILGDENERRLYDEAREREARYVNAPELAAMQRRVRFSARQREKDQGEPRVARRRRFGMLPVPGRLPRWVRLLMMLFWVSALLPFVLRTGEMNTAREKKEPQKEKPEPPEAVVRERLARMRADLEAAAAAGDARAQLRLGLLLYSGSAGVQMNRPAAREWWQKAAEQGNEVAVYYLEKCDFTQPPPEPASTAEDEAPAPSPAEGEPAPVAQP